jgi:hypothetical protein
VADLKIREVSALVISGCFITQNQGTAPQCLNVQTCTKTLAKQSSQQLTKQSGYPLRELLHINNCLCADFC